MIWFVTRLFISAILIAFAMGLAGLYGMVHNQISYSYAPTYFVDLKFPQFGIPVADRDEIGAALVGWYASWWMGTILGALFVLQGFRISSHTTFVWAFLKSSILIVILTLLLGVLALIWAVNFVEARHIPNNFLTYGSQEPLKFFHAAIMHSASYTAAGVSLVIAYFLIFRRKIRNQ